MSKKYEASEIEKKNFIRNIAELQEKIEIFTKSRPQVRNYNILLFYLKSRFFSGCRRKNQANRNNC